jgi:TPP-dependent indolepyruvate ferredoxin oxidoreductase alpha subunit
MLMSGYLGSIGFGYPAAIGGWAAVQADGSGRRLLAVTGDGGFGQYLAELTTAVKHHVDITQVLLNNGLGRLADHAPQPGLRGVRGAVPGARVAGDRGRRPRRGARRGPRGRRAVGRRGGEDPDLV